MENSIKITLDLLEILMQDGYQSLFRKWGEDLYIPKVEAAEDLADTISIVPLREDTLFAIADAIIYYDNLELDGSRISNIFN